MLKTAVSLYLMQWHYLQSGRSSVGLLDGQELIGLDADFDQTSGKRQDVHVTRMTLKNLGT